MAFRRVFCFAAASMYRSCSSLQAASYQVHNVILFFRMLWRSGDFLVRYFHNFSFYFWHQWVCCSSWKHLKMNGAFYIVVNAYKFTAFVILDFSYYHILCVHDISVLKSTDCIIKCRHNSIFHVLWDLGWLSTLKQCCRNCGATGQSPQRNFNR